MQKLYVYVDESGQDAGSQFFVVVAVLVEAGIRERLLHQLEDIEREVKTNKLKWHKLDQGRRVQYLHSILSRKIAHGNVFVVYYKKPIPFFFPLVEIVEKAVRRVARSVYRVRVCVDGIDRQKAQELTNALRARKIALDLVKGLRDESEPLIRLADMWAGCLRHAFLGYSDATHLLLRSKASGYLIDLTT